MFKGRSVPCTHRVALGAKVSLGSYFCPMQGQILSLLPKSQ